MQRKILEKLRESYPDNINVRKLPDYRSGQKFFFNLFYLNEYGLTKIEGCEVADPKIAGIKSIYGNLRITAKGLDFLEDDGGIGAILNRVIVKFDESDFSKLLDAIDNQDLPDEKKSQIRKTLSSLPSEGLKTLFNELIKKGLGNVPQLLILAEKILSNYSVGP